MVNLMPSRLKNRISEPIARLKLPFQLKGAPMPSIRAGTWETLNGLDAKKCKPPMAAGTLLGLSIGSRAITKNALWPICPITEPV